MRRPPPPSGRAGSAAGRPRERDGIRHHRDRPEARAGAAGRQRGGERGRRHAIAGSAGQQHPGPADDRTVGQFRQRFQPGQDLHSRRRREHLDDGQLDRRRLPCRRRLCRARRGAAHLAVRRRAGRGAARAAGRAVRPQRGRRLDQPDHRQADRQFRRLCAADLWQLQRDHRRGRHRRPDRRRRQLPRRRPRPRIATASA